MKSLLIHIGHADIAEVEKQINEKIKDLTGFSSLKVTSNGQNDMAVVLYDDDSSEVKTPAVKIVQFSITDTTEAQKTIDAALEDLDVISVEPTCVVNMNRLLVVYDAATSDSSSDSGDSSSTDPKAETTPATE